MTKSSETGHDPLGPPPRVVIHPPPTPVSAAPAQRLNSHADVEKQAEHVPASEHLEARAEDSTVIRLQSKGRQLQIDLKAGGRITEFSLRGKNLLTGPSVHPVFYGSTVWPAPESDWGQPPPESFDRIQFAPQELLPSRVTCVSTQESRVAMGAKCFHIEKTFVAEPERGTFLHSYTLRNSDPRKSEPRKSFALAAWEVTRVLPGGVTFFPYERSVREPADFCFEVEGGVAWYDHRTMAHSGGSKLWASGREGWLAHVAGNMLFIKEFQALRADELAPGEGDVELYSSGLSDTPGSYVELEVLGPYRLLAPNGGATLRVRWHLLEIDPGQDTRPASHVFSEQTMPSREELLALVRAQL